MDDEAGEQQDLPSGEPARSAVPPPQVPGAASSRVRPVAPLAPIPGLTAARPAEPPGALPPLPQLVPSAEPQSEPPFTPAGGAVAAAPPKETWGWQATVAGLALAYVPQILLFALAALMGGGTTDAGRATLSSAIALIIGSLVIYGFQVFSAWLFSARTAGGVVRAWGFRRPTKAFFWTIPLGLFAVYAASLLHDKVVRPEQQQIMSDFPHSTGGTVAFVVYAVAMAPFLEEIFFRGFLFRGFAKSWGWVWGAVVSATVFSLAHLQLSIFVPLFALGFVLAWVYKRTGSLWTSIALHAVFNSIAMIAWIMTG
jgi:membrane protease YdiL (CAAX protease family)